MWLGSCRGEAGDVGDRRQLCESCQVETELAERLRAICMALPEVTERPSHGAPAWFIRDKKPPPIDWTEVADLCEDAYRAVAPARLIAQLDD
jgi:hypothetical protein